MNKVKYLTLAALLLVPLAALHAASPSAAGAPAGESSNAKEAVAKKNAEDQVIAEKYAALVASLPPDRQAWERTLQENLGGFYLPIHKRLRVQGRSSCWDFVQDDPKLPHVLLIGDSVSGGYTLATRKLLTGRANVHKAPENCGPTANGLRKLGVWLAGEKWEAIHFNFGIHDRKTPPDVYEQNLEQLVARLEKTGAKLIWASTTPVPPDTKDGDKMPAAIVERNKIAARVMQKHRIVTDDLHGWILPDLAKYQNPHDVHFNGAGYNRIAERVVRVIDVALPKVEGVNSAIVPAGKIENDSYHWEARHEMVMKIKDRLKPEVVLIGDSITHFWGGLPDGGKSGNRGLEPWRALFGTRPVLNLGFGWDRTQNALKRIELGELDGIAPKAIVIHIGTNNLAATPHSRANSAKEIAEAIKMIVERAQAKCPRAQIILMAIFPRGPGTTNPQRVTIADINQRLAPLAQKLRVTLLDITAKWLQPDGSVAAELMPDLLHPNAKGYAVWAEALRSALPN